MWRPAVRQLSVEFGPVDSWMEWTDNGDALLYFRSGGGDIVAAMLPRSIAPETIDCFRETDLIGHYLTITGSHAIPQAA